MIISHEYNEQKLGELTHRFEQLLRQQEYAHQQEVLELQGSIEYLQEKLVTDREQREALEQELEDANMKLLERSEEMGSIRAELSDLRKEVQELREYKAKHKARTYWMSITYSLCRIYPIDCYSVKCKMWRNLEKN
ncbi:hypothetical protein ANCCAN_15329 [Ancylostoma caninum]|uniref:Uncharacterized protein n=1 Tax=Ancylostoma caninum TaxID=29170 RepID=A0A368G6Y2_ANCCA|nr:hypothetical protein ANCCAN_15329 [Ancylostoma caninum]